MSKYMVDLVFEADMKLAKERKSELEAQEEKQTHEAGGQSGSPAGLDPGSTLNKTCGRGGSKQRTHRRRPRISE